jgi:hypothetical protein
VADLATLLAAPLVALFGVIAQEVAISSAFLALEVQPFY